MKLIIMMMLLLLSNISNAQMIGKLIKLDNCVIQISDDKETKYSGKQYLNLTKIEKIMTALNHVELMQNGKGILVTATPDEKEAIINAFIACSK